MAHLYNTVSLHIKLIGIFYVFIFNILHYLHFCFLCFRDATSLTESSGSPASFTHSSSFQIPPRPQASCFQPFHESLHPALERLSEARRKHSFETSVRDVINNNTSLMCFQHPNTF